MIDLKSLREIILNTTVTHEQQCVCGTWINREFANLLSSEALELIDRLEKAESQLKDGGRIITDSPPPTSRH